MASEWAPIALVVETICQAGGDRLSSVSLLRGLAS